MNTPLERLVTVQVQALTGSKFQQFIEKLFEAKYGSEFKHIKPTKDKGCDGLLWAGKTIIACYGTARHDLKQFVKKAEEDFAAYQQHWETQYPNWMFITNQEITADDVMKLQGIKPEADWKGIKEILALYNKLHLKARNEIAEALNIPREFLAQDYLQEILKDLLKGPDSSEPRKPYVEPLYFADKVQLNYDEAEIEEVYNSYRLYVKYFPTIARLMGNYGDEATDKLKDRIMGDYRDTRGNCATRLNYLTKNYLAQYATKNDDNYRLYVRAILLYIFEQCLIGKKTKTEKEHDTTSS